MQLTGLVVYGDSTIGVANASVSAPGSRRTTLTNEAGYFSLPVVAGDRVAVRYHEQVQYIAIPIDYPGRSYSAVVQLLDGPKVMPTLPTEFQNQFLRLPAVNASYYDVRPVFYDPKSLKDTFKQLRKK